MTPVTIRLPFDVCARLADRGMGPYVAQQLHKQVGDCRVVDPDGDTVRIIRGKGVR